MIDKSKTYRTRDGREVRIYATDGVGKKSVHGAYFDNHVKGWISLVWTQFGRVDAYQELQPLDLIEVRPRHKRTVWLNLYDDSPNVIGWNSKNEADAPGAKRLACIKIDLDFEEGEGL
jgi:hypothetical protein